MKENIIIIISLLFSINIYAQEIQYGIGTGIGSYNMGDLKKINNEVLQNLPFESKIVSNFPSFFYYQPSIILREKNFGFGICYKFESTGSRISSSDYSGEYRYDMIIYSNSPCFIAVYDISVSNNIRIGLYALAGLVFTNLKMNEYLHVIDTTLTNSTYKFNAQNEIVEPGFSVNYNLKNIGLMLNLGYLIQTKDGSFSTNNDQNSNTNSIKPNWNGYRIGLTFFYNIASKNKKNGSNIK